MEKLKALYAMQERQSHLRVAGVYRGLMQSECEIVADGYEFPDRRRER